MFKPNKPESANIFKANRFLLFILNRRRGTISLIAPLIRYRFYTTRLLLVDIRYSQMFFAHVYEPIRR